VNVPVERIGEIIGPGGKTIRSIVERTGAKIDIEDDGTVFIRLRRRKAAKRRPRSSPTWCAKSRSARFTPARDAHSQLRRLSWRFCPDAKV
jgi:hypothetical protein